MSSYTPFREIIDVFELKNQPEVLRNLKNYVKFLVYDLFDPHYTYGRRTLDLQHSILQKTCEKFPHLFAGATHNARIRAIRSFAMNQFGYRRLLFRRENELKSRRAKEEPQPLHSPQPHRTQNLGLENDLNSSAQQVQIRESASAVWPGSEPLSNAPIPVVSPVISGALPMNAPCIPPTSASSTGINAAPIAQTDEVATFLSSCVPNMKYLLDCFIAYGIVSREYLRTIAKSKGFCESLVVRRFLRISF